MLQWYPKVPAVVKVWVNELPAAMSPLLKEPPSAVTVWVTESWFVHVTVLFTPITTVIEFGLNEKFWMLTLAVLCATATCGTKTDANPVASKAITNNETRTVFVSGDVFCAIEGHIVILRRAATPKSSKPAIPNMNG